MYTQNPCTAKNSTTKQIKFRTLYYKEKHNNEIIKEIVNEIIEDGELSKRYNHLHNEKPQDYN